MGLSTPTTLDPNATAQVKGIDRASAAKLEVGITNANAIDVGKVGATTNNLGGLGVKTSSLDIFTSFQVTGNARVNGNMAIGDTAMSLSRLLNINQAALDPLSDGRGLFIDVGLFNTNGSPHLYGAEINARLVAGADFGAGGLTGLKVLASHGSSFGLTLGTGFLVGVATVAAAAAVTTMTALNIDAPNYAGSKPTNGIGLQIENQGVAGVTTSTALQIQAQSGSTNNLAIDQQGNTGRNIFAGSIETPATALTIANGSNNNLALGSQGNHFRATGHTIPSDITGIAGGVSGRRITIVNQGAEYLTLTNEDTLSTAANRIQTKTGSRLLLGGGSVSLIYDATSSRWVVDSAQTEIGRVIGSLFITADHSTASTTYVDLTQADSVDFFLELPGKVQVTYNAQMYNSLASTVMSNIVDIDGVDDTTSEVNQTSHSVANAQTSTNCMWLSGQLAAGQHTVKIQHKVAAGTGHWLRRQLLVTRVE